MTDGARRRFSRRHMVGMIGVAATGVGAATWLGPSATSSANKEIDLNKLRRIWASRPYIPYEVLFSADSLGDADAIMRDGWNYGFGFPVTRLDLPIDWTKLCMSNRSWNYTLHTWDFMSPGLRAFNRTKARRYLNWCVERGVSWARTFNESDGQGTMAWYDMTIGRRGHRLAYLVETAVLNDVDEQSVRVLLDCVARHRSEFTAERSFNPRTNHGLFVAVGQQALARRLDPLPGMRELRSQGRRRMATVLPTQFAADGGHLEHSPGYHLVLLPVFRSILRTGLLDDAETRNRIKLAEEVVGWYIQPNGELAQIGDSDASLLRGRSARSPDPATEFHLSAGRRGVPPRGKLKVLRETGYAIVRSPQPQGSGDHQAAAYLFLNAAFHSRTHKHADDLSITWFDRQREILIDAGRFGYLHHVLPEEHPLRKKGYLYSAPERQYVESTPAHNTVTMDGADHVRIGRKPYGSAIRDARERDGHFLLRAEVDHGKWRHRREIIFRPAEWLYVIDAVTARDVRRHDFQVWWNFPAALRPRNAGRSALVIAMPSSQESLWINDLSGSDIVLPVSGQRDPLRGWRSKSDNQLMPAWSTGFQVRGVRQFTFRTLLHFGTRPRTTPAPHPFQERVGQPG